ncbi:hypothetical protein MTO96_051398 [Rhipicephalus appendiculatus]
MTGVHPSTLPAAADASMPMDLVHESGPTFPDDSPDKEPCKNVTVQTDLTMADLQAMQVENEKLACSLHSVEQQKRHFSTASQALDTDNQRLDKELCLLAAQNEKLEATEHSSKIIEKFSFIQG